MSRDIVPAGLGNIIKVESVTDSIASKVTKRMIVRVNMIIFNTPDRMAINSVRNSMLKATNLHDSPCQYI